MDNTFSRTEMLIGKDSMERLTKANILIFGCGGVGSYIIEALVRSGIRNITIVDGDVVSESNINRQIIATKNTVGKSKVEVTKERILSINPNCNVNAVDMFVTKDNINLFNFSEYSYIADAIDTTSTKIAIIENAKKLSIPIISSMGTGNKLDPTRFKITDIERTTTCPLARVIRKELKDRNIKNVKVLWSDEQPIKSSIIDETTGKSIPASISFVPSSAGLLIAGEIIKDIIKTI